MKGNLLYLLQTFVYIYFVLNLNQCYSINTSTQKIITPNYKQSCKSTTESSKNTNFHLRNFVPSGIKNGLASILATIVVKLSLQPFDTIKTVQQMNNFKLNVISTAISIIDKRGFLGLWSGIGVTVIGSMPSVAVYFSIFNNAKIKFASILPSSYRPLAVALAAMVANTIACVLRVPYEVLKHRMQMERHSTLFEAISFSIKEEGIFGMFNSGKLAIQIIRDVPYAVITAVCYELLQGALNNHFDIIHNNNNINNNNNTHNRKDIINKVSNKVSKQQSVCHIDTTTTVSPITRRRTAQDALCGSIAGAISITLTTPMDVIKTRLMSGGHQYDYTSVSDAITRIVKEEGMSAFTLGMSSRLLHKIPANGLFYVCYELFRSLLGVGEHYQ